MVGDVRRVLLVEDDVVDQMNVRRALKKSGADVELVVAEHGAQGLQMLREQESPRGTLVLLDLNMPLMGGLEMLEAVRGDPRLRSLPVVVLTTSDDDRDRDAAYDLNVAGYLLKPVDAGRFNDMVDRVVAYWGLSRLP